MMPMERAHGPECPNCGCEATELDPSRPPTWWHPPKDATDDTPSRKFTPHVCTHCGYRFSAETEEAVPDAVEFVPVRCPACRVTATVNTTRRPVRYHKCRNCGKHFKSVERQDI